MSSGLAQREHFVYRIFDVRGNLLYVGLTHDVSKRLRDHAGTKSWWAEVDPARTLVAPYPSHADAARAELAAIEAEGPRCNRRRALQVLSTKPSMVMRSIRVPLALWTAAKEKADERDENISDVIREALERYVKSRR